MRTVIAGDRLEYARPMHLTRRSWFTAVVGALLLGPRLAAADAMPKLPGTIAIKDVVASSTYPDKRDAYAAWRTVAYEERTSFDAPPVLWSAWCEGKKDEGVGETITIRLAEPTQLDRLQIAAGVWRTAKLFAANNKIKALTVTVDGTAHTVRPPSGRKRVEVPIGAKVSTIVVRIDKVEKGTMNDSCISAIDLVRSGERLVPIVGADARAVTTLPSSVEAIAAALSSETHKGLEPLIELPFTNENADMAMGYGGGEPMTSKTYKELAAACKRLVAEREASGGEPTSTACPDPVDVDPDDDRPPSLRALAPGTVEIAWPSHREVLVTWRLHYTDRWRLQAVGYTGI